MEQYEEMTHCECCNWNNTMNVKHVVYSVKKSCNAIKMNYEVIMYSPDDIMFRKRHHLVLADTMNQIGLIQTNIKNIKQCATTGLHLTRQCDLVAIIIIIEKNMKKGISSKKNTTKS